MGEDDLAIIERYGRALVAHEEALARLDALAAYVRSDGTFREAMARLYPLATQRQAAMDVLDDARIALDMLMRRKFGEKA